MTTNPDSLICGDGWSDLTQHRQPEPVDDERLHRWRLSRLSGQLEQTGAAMCLLVSPVSLRYAVNYRDYPLFQSHMPQTYLFYQWKGQPSFMAPWGDPHGLMTPVRAGPFHFLMGPSALANMLGDWPMMS